MQFYHVGVTWILLFGLLAGCGDRPTESATPPPIGGERTPGVSGTVAPQPANPQIAGYPTEADEVVRTFLSALQEDLSGQSSLRYLSSERQQEVLQGRPLPVLLGLQNIYNSFMVSDTLSVPGATTAQVTAVLELRQPAERSFKLIRENQEWHIADIVPITEGVLPPAQVVTDFLDSLYADPSGEQSTLYVSPALRQRLEQAGLGILEIEAPYDSFSVAPVAASGPEVSVEATLGFGGDTLERTFTLNRQGDSWLISAIH